MTHTLPQLLPECEVATQHFCASCRDRDKGRSFRTSVLQIRGIEGVKVDFECPKKKQWGDGQLLSNPEQLPSRGLGDTIAKVTKAVGIKPCGGCKARQAKLNTLVPYKVDKGPA